MFKSHLKVLVRIGSDNWTYKHLVLTKKNVIEQLYFLYLKCLKLQYFWGKKTLSVNGCV